MTPHRQRPDDSRTVQVRLMRPAQEPSNPLADLLPLSAEEARVLFAFANRNLNLGSRTPNPTEQNTGPSSTNPATATKPN